MKYAQFQGKFFKENAAGYIGVYIDYADPHCKCGCGRPFAPFYDILDGFKSNHVPDNCSKMSG
jgi:hypothetical protein